jgi:hypothetical protein
LPNTLAHFIKSLQFEFIQKPTRCVFKQSKNKTENRNLEKDSKQKKKPSSHWADPDQNQPSSPEPA